MDDTTEDMGAADVTRSSESPRGQDDRDPDVDTADGVEKAVVDAFEEELADCRRRADENWDKYLRAEAELDNYRRLAQRRTTEAVDRATRALLESFLEVADNLERALAFGDTDAGALLSGVEATYRELSRLLEREGVELIAAMDEPFDPTVHEAVGVVAMPGLQGERVVAVERPGYKMKDELLRPARVVVGKPPEG
jgi:molecular chaperone GrpE